MTATISTGKLVKPVGLCATGQPTAIDPDWFFRGEETAEFAVALALCEECPLRQTCADYAHLEGVPYGVWGGTPASARRARWSVTGGRPQHFFLSIHEALGKETDGYGAERKAS
jgi:hypothetical protein